jgi:hypothetical protein
VEPAVDLGRATVVFVMLRGGSPDEPAGDRTGLFWPGYAYPPMMGERLTIGSAESLAADSLAVDSLAGAGPAADSAAGRPGAAPPGPPDTE